MEQKNLSFITIGFRAWIIIFIIVIFILNRKIDTAITAHTERTDKLYEMFVTVQKEIKDISNRTCVIETKIEERGKK